MLWQLNRVTWDIEVKKICIIGEHILELRAYLSKLEAAKDENFEEKVINRPLATQKFKGNTLKDEWI